jgi:cysteinyl-tRNA synthetase
VYGVIRDANDKFGHLQAAQEPSDEFMAALLDDLNTPDALAELNSEARRLANADNAETARAVGGKLLAAANLI